MKVTLERNQLLKSLGHVHRVVERRNTYPILANVLLRAAEGTLDLRATDLDIEVTESVPAMVATAGTTTVPAHTLYEIVRKLADGAEVRLETEGGEQMLLTSGRSRFHLACLSPDSFPDLKSGTFTHEFSIAASALRELIERTQFAISSEETRYYLNGIYIHTLEVDGVSLLRAVATDGHRMARAEVEAPAGAKGMPDSLVAGLSGGGPLSLHIETTVAGMSGFQGRTFDDALKSWSAKGGRLTAFKSEVQAGTLSLYSHADALSLQGDGHVAGHLELEMSGTFRPVEVLGALRIVSPENMTLARPLLDMTLATKDTQKFGIDFRDGGAYIGLLKVSDAPIFP